MIGLLNHLKNLKRGSRTRGLMVITALAGGCGGTAVTETGEGGGTSSDLGAFDDHLIECGAPQLCPLLSYQAYAPPNLPSTPSEADYDCALSSLRDRTPSLLVASYGCEGMCHGDVILIRPDGTALRQSWTQALDGGVQIGGLTVEFQPWEEAGEGCTLKPSSFYDTCDSSVDGDCDSVSEWWATCSSVAEQSCDL